MYTSTLTSKGQVTIPAALRIACGLSRGDEVEFSLSDHTISVRRRINDIRQAFGLCKAKCSASLEEMEKAIVERGRS